MTYFQGCDFTNSPANVDDNKSPNCVNMIRDVPGKIRKSMGYHTIMKYPDKVNGSFYLRSSDEQLIHAGEKIYHNNVLLYDGANNHRSKAWQFDDKLYIQDGKELLMHECIKAEVEEGQTTGKHTKDVIGLTYEEKVKVVDGDKINFVMPYPIDKIEIGDDVIELEEATEYSHTFETGGEYTIKFYAHYVVETVDAEGTFTLALAEGSTVTFPEKDYGKLTVSFTDSIGQTVTHDIEREWENTYEDNVFTFDYNNLFTEKRYYEEYQIDAKEGETITFKAKPGNKLLYVGISYSYLDESGKLHRETETIGERESSVSWTCPYELIASAYIRFAIANDFVEKGEISDDISSQIKPGDSIKFYGDQINYYSYNVHDFWTDEKGMHMNINTFSRAFPVGAFVNDYTITCPQNQGTHEYSISGININSVGEYLGYTINPSEKEDFIDVTYSEKHIGVLPIEVEYIDHKGMKGTLSYIVNNEEVDGFINNLNGEYIDEEGYKRIIKPVREDAYIPTVTIAKEPSGGGQSYESLNLIQPGFIELFAGTQSDTAFQLSFEGLDETEVIVKLLDNNGDWIEKKEGVDFNVNREKGIINFVSAPGPSPLTGEDNVSIQAYRTVEGYADRINKCTISTLFGVNGNADRLFVSGNPEYINYDWYSDQYNPTYFPDTGYAVLGSHSSAIVGYSIISNYLAACKDDKERDANIVLREGDLQDNEPSFPIVATLQGSGAVAPWSFSYLETEPIFLTKRGIYAVTAQDITGEKYSQNRSYFLDGKMLDEKDLQNAYACVFNDFYILGINGKLYILDGLQPIQTDKSMPYSTRQYAGFYRENVPANCLWTFDDKLYFGTDDGRVCEFYTDKDDLYSYNDDGEAIECVWESPDLDGKYFFKNKTFRYLAVRLDSAISTSINIFTMKRGIWNLAKTDSTKARYFTFPFLNFAKFSFSTDTTQKIIHTKLRVKKVDKARFRFTNTEVNEPFGLFDVALEYIENGNYKG